MLLRAGSACEARELQDECGHWACAGSVKSISVASPSSNRRGPTTQRKVNFSVSLSLKELRNEGNGGVTGVPSLCHSRTFALYDEIGVVEHASV